MHLFSTWLTSAWALGPHQLLAHQGWVVLDCAPWLLQGRLASVDLHYIKTKSLRNTLTVYYNKNHWIFGLHPPSFQNGFYSGCKKMDEVLKTSCSKLKVYFYIHNKAWYYRTITYYASPEFFSRPQNISDMYSLLYTVCDSIALCPCGCT
jgi:hypothetical protein